MGWLDGFIFHFLWLSHEDHETSNHIILLFFKSGFFANAHLSLGLDGHGFTRLILMTRVKSDAQETSVRLKHHKKAALDFSIESR
jgi:hypothetical protein